MTTDFEVLLDSDALVGLMVEHDAHHQRASAEFERLMKQTTRIVASSYVVDETATVISHKANQPLARHFLTTVRKIRLPVVHVDEKLRQAALAVFGGEKARGTSMTDCVNVALMRSLHISKIFAFDEVYTKRFRLKSLIYSE